MSFNAKGKGSVSLVQQEYEDFGETGIVDMHEEGDRGGEDCLMGVRFKDGASGEEGEDCLARRLKE